MQRTSVTQNATITTFSTVGQGAFNLATVVYLARVLQPTTYGVFSYTWAVIGIVGVVAYLGIPPLLTRQLSRSSSLQNNVSYGISLVILVTLAVALAFFVSIEFIPAFYRYRRLFDLWTVFLLFSSLNPRWIFAALGQLWISSVGDLAGTILRVGFIFWLVHGPSDIAKAITITGASLALPLFLEYGWLHRQIPFTLQLVPLDQAWQTIRTAVPLAVTGFVSVLYVGLDTWILHVFIGSKAVGIYSAAYRPLTFLSTFSGIYFNLTFPILSRLTMTDRRLTRKVLQLATIALIAVILPMGLGTDLVATALIKQAFGSAYVGSGIILAVLIWSWGFGIVRDTFSTTLLAANREKEFAWIFLGVGVFNTGLMLIFVRWGPVGTAAALVITQLVLMVLCVLAVRRVVPNPIDWGGQWGSLVKIVVNSVLMGLAVWVVRPYVPVEVAIAMGIVLYGGLTWATGAVPWQEILSTMQIGQPDSNPD